MRFKSKIQDYKLMVRAKASLGERFDEKALDDFCRVYMRGFLKAKPIRKNLIEYSGPVGAPLYERLKDPISKRDFLFIMEQLVLAVQKIQGHRLLLQKVVLDLRYVYFNDVTKEVQLLYVPSTKEDPGADMMGFVESIIYSAKPDSSSDKEFFSRFTHFVKALDCFDPEKVERYIAKEDRSVVNTLKKQNVGMSGLMTNKRRPEPEPEEEEEAPKEEIPEEEPPRQERSVDFTTKKTVPTPDPEDAEDATGLLDGEEELTGLLKEEEEATGLLEEEEATGLLQEEEEVTGLLNEEEEEATGLLGEEEATGLLVEEEATGLLNEEEATGLLNEEEDDGGTALLAETPVVKRVTVKKPKPVRYPTLLRVLNDEVIQINKPVFRLGKERSYVDYFVSNNNAVSRSHADIITRGEKYFVVDLNSKNRTFINDRVLTVQYETEIRDGDHLRLGNEEFIFRVTSDGGERRNDRMCRRCNRKVESYSKFCPFCGTRIAQ